MAYNYLFPANASYQIKLYCLRWLSAKIYEKFTEIQYEKRIEACLQEYRYSD